ncbi:jerky protein homolog-like [Leptopilina boulardi]|uniref:jerky protein homolog-like n=1 Tax=Leptopilina boulardi TaxID=63433 RepID=UPI0021F593A6|nr:jerky protein homolog-like [Leptopilina boulardi]
MRTIEEKQPIKDLEKKLGVLYTNLKKAWMNRCIFQKWYKDYFIPQVLGNQIKLGISGKIVLVLDHSPTHPPLDELNAVNENVEVVYLTPNVTTLI